MAITAVAGALLSAAFTAGGLTAQITSTDRAARSAASQRQELDAAFREGWDDYRVACGSACDREPFPYGGDPGSHRRGTRM